jgi:tripartite-type tricarboxylate transporter receptor subunit TctC
VFEQVRKRIAQPDVRAVRDAQGMDADTGTPAELGSLVRHDLTKWSKIIQLANIRPE